jgi:hypothetical protein
LAVGNPDQGSHFVSGWFETLFSKRERTKKRSDNLLRKITILSPIVTELFNATTSRSARLQTVLQI